MYKIFSLLMLLTSTAFAVGGSFDASNNITGQGDARYVLRNPYYDGSQSVTVASFTSVGAGYFGGNVGISSITANAKFAIQTGATSNQMDITFAETSAKIQRVGFYEALLPAFAIQHDGTNANPNNTLNFLASSDGAVATGFDKTAMSIAQSGAVSVPLGSFSVGTSTLVVTGGKVGVGTASPKNPLYVVPLANTSAGPIANSGIHIANGATVGRMALLSFGYGGADAVNASAYMGYTDTAGTSYSYGDLIFGLRAVSTDGLPAEKMRITSAGNVGIGTTAPESKLHVAAGLVTISTATTSVSFTTFGGAATKEELIALAPSKLFQYMTCTDCPTATLVCSTGTSAGNWADAADKTATPW